MAAEENALSEIDFKKKILKVDFRGKQLDVHSIKTLIQHAKKLCIYGHKYEQNTELKLFQFELDEKRPDFDDYDHMKENFFEKNGRELTQFDIKFDIGNETFHLCYTNGIFQDIEDLELEDENECSFEKAKKKIIEAATALEKYKLIKSLFKTNKFKTRGEQAVRTIKNYLDIPPMNRSPPKTKKASPKVTNIRKGTIKKSKKSKKNTQKGGKKVHRKYTKRTRGTRRKA